MSHTLALKSDGSLWAWGRNNYGQLGDGTSTNSLTPKQIMSSGVTAISAGCLHTLALKSDGSLWAWGDNEYGQLGDGNSTNWQTPNPTPKKITSSGITAISAGAWHTLAIKSDGSLWAWGDNEYGQLGDGYERSSPQKVLTESTIINSDTTSISLFTGQRKKFELGFVPTNFDNTETIWKIKSIQDNDFVVYSPSNGVFEAYENGTAIIQVTNNSGSIVYKEFSIVVTYDKTALNSAISTANTKIQTTYTSSSWQALQSALASAKTVQANASSTQTEIDNATSSLISATNSLKQILEYSIINSTEIQITKYNDIPTTISLPSTIDGKPVTSIASGAFSNIANLTVTIPSTVTTIATDAFVSCTNLKINAFKGSFPITYAIANNINYFELTYVLGDANADSKIDGKDIAAIVMHITKVKTLADTGFSAGDVNKDGKIDGKDIAAIVMHITKVKLIIG